MFLIIIHVGMIGRELYTHVGRSVKVPAIIIHPRVMYIVALY